jgi:hypothetical protein
MKKAKDEKKWIKPVSIYKKWAKRFKENGK